MSSYPDLLKKPVRIFKLPADLHQTLNPLGDAKTENLQDVHLDVSNRIQSDSPDSSDTGEDGEEADAVQIELSNSPSGPLIWLTTPQLPTTWLGVYKVIYPTFIHKHENGELPQNGSLFFCMTGGGHFAAAIVSLEGKVIQHKTFHRYTTRRKQGGAQGTSDAAKGAAHSAGSALRRHNEAALAAEVRELLKSWKTQIDQALLLFVRATGTSNRRMLFGPYDGQVLQTTDPRMRRIPFTTRRATQIEIMRCFNELTTLKVSQKDPTPVIATIPKPSAPTRVVDRPVSPKLSEEEQAASLHTGQITSLIRRSKAPALLSYLTSNGLSSSFSLFPPSANYHAPTLLHLAASLNSAAVVTALLLRANADPTPKNRDGRTAFELTGDKATRYAFRVARFDLGEDKWDWEAGNVPPRISKSEADKKLNEGKRADEEAEAARRKMETASLTESRVDDKKSKNPTQSSAREKREAEAKGLSPEMRMKLERERRARAAEARMKATSSNS